MKAHFSARRSWILSLLFSVSVAACAALDGGEDAAGTAGVGGSGAHSGNGGNIDYDASAGGTSSGGFAHLCGRSTCDLDAKAAVSSCQNNGSASGGSGGSAGTGGAGASSGSTSGATTGSSGSGGAATGGGGGGASGGSAGGAGAGGAGAGGAGGADAGGSGGAGGSGAAAGVGGSGGASGSSSGGAGGAGAGPALDVACKLVLTDDGVARECVASGSAPELSPCTTSSDCGPGLGCVFPPEQGTGVCRAYCCGSEEECAPHTFCAAVPLTEAGDPDVVIPVCIDADDCTLLEQGQCADGLVCSVVRGDGTTSCMPPGPGQQGDECPCAAGFACTKLVDQCRKICHTDPQASLEECPIGLKCQGNAAMPDGFGLCVDPSAL